VWRGGTQSSSVCSFGALEGGLRRSRERCSDRLAGRYGYTARPGPAAATRHLSSGAHLRNAVIIEIEQAQRDLGGKSPGARCTASTDVSRNVSAWKRAAPSASSSTRDRPRSSAGSPYYSPNVVDGVIRSPGVVLQAQASLLLSFHSIGSQSSTLFPSGSIIHANLPFSCDSGPPTISIPEARSCASISSRSSTR
jgi:hypothetical protein